MLKNFVNKRTIIDQPLWSTLVVGLSAALLCISIILVLQPRFRHSLLNFFTNLRHGNAYLLLPTPYDQLFNYAEIRRNYQRNPAVAGLMLILVSFLLEKAMPFCVFSLHNSRLVNEYLSNFPSARIIYNASDMEFGASQAKLDHKHTISFFERIEPRFVQFAEFIRLGEEILGESIFKNFILGDESGCKIAIVKFYRPGQLEVTVSRQIERHFGNGTNDFKTVGGEQQRFSGLDGITRAGNQRTIFMFPEYPEEDVGASLLYLEYSFGKSSEIFLHMIEDEDEILNVGEVTERNEKNAILFRVSCSGNISAPKQYPSMVMMYQKAHLDFKINEGEYKENEPFTAWTKNNSVQAVLHVKVMNDDGSRTPQISYWFSGYTFRIWPFFPISMIFYWLLCGCLRIW